MRLVSPVDVVDHAHARVASHQTDKKRTKKEGPRGGPGGPDVLEHVLLVILTSAQLPAKMWQSDCPDIVGSATLCSGRR